MRNSSKLFPKTPKKDKIDIKTKKIKKPNKKFKSSNNNDHNLDNKNEIDLISVKNKILTEVQNNLDDILNIKFSTHNIKNLENLMDIFMNKTQVISKKQFKNFINLISNIFHNYYCALMNDTDNASVKDIIYKRFLELVNVVFSSKLSIFSKNIKLELVYRKAFIKFYMTYKAPIMVKLSYVYRDKILQKFEKFEQQNNLKTFISFLDSICKYNDLLDSNRFLIDSSLLLQTRSLRLNELILDPELFVKSNHKILQEDYNILILTLNEIIDKNSITGLMVEDLEYLNKRFDKYFYKIGGLIKYKDRIETKMNMKTSSILNKINKRKLQILNKTLNSSNNQKYKNIEKINQDKSIQESIQFTTHKMSKTSNPASDFGKNIRGIFNKSKKQSQYPKKQLKIENNKIDTDNKNKFSKIFDTFNIEGDITNNKTSKFSLKLLVQKWISVSKVQENYCK